MVARIRTGKSIRGAINYNEHKVRCNQATLILAHRYPKIAEDLSFNDKINRFQKLTTLNSRTTTNCLHVSLNFDPSERLSEDQLKEIANEYMQAINFGHQPYLVYEHTDAAHQHIHIVSTNIQPDGKRISFHNLGKNESEQARKEIEQKYKLVRAEGKSFDFHATGLKKVTYGLQESRRAISNVVVNVVSSYKFSSLAELNAALQQFNVIADRGEPGSRMYERGGLKYSIIDDNGNRIGVPVRAGSLYIKPTLKLLQRKFEINKEAKVKFKGTLKGKVDEALLKSGNLVSFTELMQKNGVAVVFRKNEDNFIYGITYVDHSTRCVFNGSELGKQYSAASVTGRFKGEDKNGTDENVPQHADTSKLKIQTEAHTQPDLKVLEILLDRVEVSNYVPYQFRKKRKRKSDVNRGK